MKKIIALLAIMLLFASSAAYAEHTNDASYIYDFWGNANNSMGAFELSSVIDNTNMPEDISIKGINDIYVHNGRISLIDTAQNRLNVFTETYEFVTSVKIVREPSGKIVVSEDTGKQMILNGPEGVYATDEYIYIADTGNERIIILDANTFAYVREITRPENMVGVTLFKPSKIAVDESGRMFVVVKNSTEGIVELNEDGSFSCYFGVNSPKVNIIDYLWKSMASAEQRAKMSKVYAPAFSNVQTDNEGFVYAVTLDTASENMVFRMNSKGENVIRLFGYSEQLGDLVTPTNTEQSRFADIAVSDYGVYALLDTAKGRVFIYNFDGNLLSIFGGSGDIKGTFKEPTSIAWQGDSLIVGDARLSSAYVFTPTDFGKLILEAEKRYNAGDFEAAAQLQLEVIDMNANYDHAYVSIGKNLLMEDEYEEAMVYFSLGNDKTYYSKAYAGYRNIQIQRNFIWFAIVFLLFVVWILRGEYQYNKRQRQLEEL
ncbi:MAG: hypothetical protein Q4C12_04505 [Clostridia bacterium]|nr:hypothetical protein [Clostridia bacterium]